MVTVTFFDDGEKLGITAEGHAGSAPYGEDLICAAVTALIYTAGTIAVNMSDAGLSERDPVVKMESGNAYIAMYPRLGCLRDARIRLSVVQTGIRFLSEQYPDHVGVKCFIGNGNQPNT